MDKSKINISHMTRQYLAEIKDILIDEFDDFWDYNTLESELLSPTSTYIIARINNDVCGFAGIKKILDEAELMNIVVNKKFRYLGIGSQLLEYIICMCKDEKIKKINLEVNSQNILAINLYKKYNFNEVGLRKKYYNGTFDAILMNLNITDIINK